jgi:hypothetical protein
MPSPLLDVTGSTVKQEATLEPGLVVASIQPLKIHVREFKYDIGGNRGIYSGAIAQSVADDDTNYVYLDSTATLQINTTGFPTDTHIPLSRVPTANGEIIQCYPERVLLAASSSAQGTCRIGFPVDAGIRGDGSNASSNNNVASITFPNTAGTDPRNRWELRPPQNYISGNLTIRLLVSVSGTPGSTKVRWKFEWGFNSSGDALPSSGNYPYSVEVSKDMAAISSDVSFDVELTIPSANFNKTKDMMYCWLSRYNDHADDDCTLTQHVHMIELQYLGYKLAGQSGQ